ncbi:hypothetical protein M8044_000258 [Columbia Basin potato purple top phytoplasma]|uniref:Uncharacterized protein n=1 Tax=Columbia Basin potato purple top phytoplasma TaxID=307134 RepID=A0ABT5L929_9MOLU|nr:hypothetical protein [Columbia Basin potato purple top phytoplasma]
MKEGVILNTEIYIQKHVYLDCRNIFVNKFII